MTTPGDSEYRQMMVDNDAFGESPFSAEDPNNPWYCDRCGLVHPDGECPADDYGDEEDG